MEAGFSMSRKTKIAGKKTRPPLGGSRRSAASSRAAKAVRAPGLLLEEFALMSAGIASCLRSEQPGAIAERLCHHLQALVGADAAYVGFLRRSAPPIALLNAASEDRDRQYVEGAYLLDPNYSLFLQSNPTVCIALKDTAADEFRRGDYYKTYYRYSGVIDEVAFLVRLADDVAAHVCLMRLTGSAPFKKSDVGRLVAVQPLVEVVAERLWSRMSAGDTSQTAADREAHRLFAATFAQFGSDVLSERKLEIMRLLLKGHGAKAIGRFLNISSGTVRNHMKQIYLNLGVTSQSALFALFFEALMRSGAADAPA